MLYIQITQGVSERIIARTDDRSDIHVYTREIRSKSIVSSEPAHEIMLLIT